MNNFPEHIINYIHEYIPVNYLVVLSKTNYDTYHTAQRDMIPKSVFHGYIRDMIRKDNDYILYYILQEYNDTWNRKKNIVYKKSTYENYTVYLMYYSIEQESIQCHKLLKRLYNTDVKQHKKVRSKKYKWIH